MSELSWFFGPMVIGLSFTFIPLFLVYRKGGMKALQDVQSEMSKANHHRDIGQSHNAAGFFF